MKPNRKLPDGSITSSVDEYIDRWKTPVKPLMTILGWSLCAMDPGYQFEDPWGQRVNLTVSQANQLVEKLVIASAQADEQLKFAESALAKARAEAAALREAGQRMADAFDDSFPQLDDLRYVLDSTTAGADLLAEVERLREDRARIVAWLRKRQREYQRMESMPRADGAMNHAADAIEAGEHEEDE